LHCVLSHRPYLYRMPPPDGCQHPRRRQGVQGAARQAKDEAA
jgi:hypothetical protein